MIGLKLARSYWSPVMLFAFIAWIIASDHSLPVTETRRFLFLDQRIRAPLRPTITQVPGAHEILSAAELRRILDRLAPSRVVTTQKVHAVIHALRLHGSGYLPVANIGGLSGQEMLAILTNAEVYHRVVQGDQFLLARTPYGVNCRIGDRFDLAPHVDKVLAVLGEIGIDSLNPIFLDLSDHAVVNDLLSDAIARFQRSQTEIEWTTVGFASYLPPQRSWTNRLGESCSFDDLIVRLIGRNLGDGPCHGCHVLYALAFVLAIDQKEEILSVPVRQQAIATLCRAADRLSANQYQTGHWDVEWQRPTSGRNQERPPTSTNTKNLIRVTGHHLEWFALASLACRPPAGTIRRAMKAVAFDILHASEDEIINGYGPMTHAARALVMLRDGAHPPQKAKH